MDLASMDPNQIALLVLQHATSGNWRALAAIGVMAAVFAIRQWALHPKALGRFSSLLWFKSDKGGVALNFIVSALGGVGNALAAHAAITKELMLTSMVNACIAAGAFVSLKRLAGRPAAIPVAPAADPVPVEAPADPAAPPSGASGTLPTFLVIMFAVASLTGCTVAQRIAGAYAGLTVAERINIEAAKQFPALDKEKRDQIVALAKTEDEGKKSLAAWDVTAEKLVKAVEGTHASVQLARDAIVEIRTGQRDARQLGGWIATAIKLGIELKDVLAASGVPLKGL